MQLLLYLNGMMDSESWTVSQDYQAPLQAACNVLADYLAQAVGGEKVQSDSGTLMKTMAAQALSDALSAMGDQQAADAVLSADQDTSSSSSSSASSDVSSVLSGAATSIQTGFNLQVFETVLLVIGAARRHAAADQHCHAGPPGAEKTVFANRPEDVALGRLFVCSSDQNFAAACNLPQFVLSCFYPIYPAGYAVPGESEKCPQ